MALSDAVSSLISSDFIVFHHFFKLFSLNERLSLSGAAPKALQLVRAERLWLPHLERRFLVPVGVLEVPDCQAIEASAADFSELGPCLLLYHGCRLRHVEGILERGFEPGFAGDKGGRFFGTGSYFTDVAAKADSYVDASPDGCRCVILAQVALGKVFRAFKSMPSFEDDRPWAVVS